MFTNRSQTHMKRVCVVDPASDWPACGRWGGEWVDGRWRVGGRRVAGGWQEGGRRVAGSQPVGTSSRWLAGRRARLAMRRVGPASVWGQRAPAGGAGRWEGPGPRRSAAPLFLAADAGCSISARLCIVVPQHPSLRFSRWSLSFEAPDLRSQV